MARIVIKDLKESVELDREAMRQITGGRSGLRPSALMSYQSSLIKLPGEHVQEGDLARALQPWRF
jgi:hypothetical protein